MVHLPSLPQQKKKKTLKLNNNNMHVRSLFSSIVSSIEAPSRSSALPSLVIQSNTYHHSPRNKDIFQMITDPVPPLCLPNDLTDTWNELQIKSKLQEIKKITHSTIYHLHFNMTMAEQGNFYLFRPQNLKKLSWIKRNNTNGLMSF